MNVRLCACCTVGPTGVRAPWADVKGDNGHRFRILCGVELALDAASASLGREALTDSIVTDWQRREIAEVLIADR